MIFRLWHKLVLTMISMMGVVLILALFISQKSVETGFLAYINQVENKRLDFITTRLVNEYRKENNWDFIRNNSELWRFYSRPQGLPRANIKPRSLPLLHELATKPGEEGDIQDLQRPPRPPRPKFDSDEPRGNILPDGPPPRPERTDRGDERRPPIGKIDRNPPPNRPPAIILLDAKKQLVVGPKEAFIDFSTSSKASLKTIYYKGKEIGFIQFELFNKFTDDLDKQFIQYQHNAFIIIALIALGIILIGAALFAAYLRARINKIGDHARLLTSGDFSSQALDTSKDEIGQLSHKLDVLGKTLQDNQTDRRRWVSDISHELRTPVAVLQGEIEAIQDGIREMNNESVNSLHHETVRLSRLVTDLHQLSLSDSGALNYEKESLNLVDLVKGIVTTHQIKFDQKNIDINFEASNQVMVHGDAQRLEQLFSNLVNNSLHYTRDSGTLNIDINKRKNNVVIEWSDSEPGVSDEELTKLFERLYRVEESRNRNAGGSGLGLSICKNIVEAHTGSIIAQHSPLGGITFVITFPIDT